MSSLPAVLSRRSALFYLGKDVHTDSSTIAVLPDLAALGDGVGHRDRRLAPLRASSATGVLPRHRLPRRLERRPRAPRLDHEGGQQSLSPCPRASGVALPASPADERRSEATAAGPTAGGDHRKCDAIAARRPRRRVHVRASSVSARTVRLSTSTIISAFRPSSTRR